MSGEDDALARLKENSLAQYEALRLTVNAVADAKIALVESCDIEKGLLAANAFSLACESVVRAAGVLNEATDEAIVDAIEDNGVPPIYTPSHVLSTRKLSASVDVLMPDAVPEEFMVAPPKRPSLRKIGAYLKKNGNTNWAVLRGGGVCLQRKSLV